MSRPLAAIFSLSTFLSTFLFVSTFLITKQLGLKLVKEIRPASVLVIDHVEQRPTDN